MKHIKSKKASVKKIGKYRGNSNQTNHVNEQGFALISFVILTPLLLTGVFAFSSLIRISHAKTALESKCLKIQNKSFHQQRERIIKLLKLNPEATRLIAQKKLLTLQIAAAVSTGQLEIAAALKIKLSKVILMQERLALKQRQILTQSKEEFLRREMIILNELVKSQSVITRQSNSLWRVHFQRPHPAYPEIAIEPAFPEIAPPYRLKKNFDQAQAWRIHWTMNIQSGTEMGTFLNINYEVKQKCEMTLQEKAFGFSIIIPDKS